MTTEEVLKIIIDCDDDDIAALQKCSRKALEKSIETCRHSEGIPGAEFILENAAGIIFEDSKSKENIPENHLWESEINKSDKSGEPYRVTIIDSETGDPVDISKHDRKLIEKETGLIYSE